MRLISCYIENFGKISDFAMDFDSDINAICKENGWGKSTLAAFIKVMFYGFENERARKDEVNNERKRYKPWQGGSYGGRIVFEAGNKTYVMSRIFGTKEKEDEFELRDEDTNRVVDDYSVNIGEELFGIDSTSFMRTIYISQSGCETSTTGSINAKLGNLIEDTDDINNYETVTKKLTDIINNMAPNRKTGELYKIKDEITRLKMAVKESDDIRNSISELEQKKLLKKKEYESVNEQLLKLQQEAEKLSATKDIRLIKAKYNNILDGIREKQEILEELKHQYTGIIPDAEALDENIEHAKEYSELKAKYDLVSLDEEQKLKYDKYHFLYGEGAYKEEQMTLILGKWDEYNELQKKLAVIEATYEANIEMINKKKTMDEENSKGSWTKGGINSKLAKVITGIVLMLIGAVVVTSNTMIGMMGIAIGAIVTVVGLLSKKSNADGHKKLSAITNDTERLKKLEEDMGIIKNQMASLKEGILAYVEMYIDGELAIDKFNEYVRHIDKSYVEYLSLGKKKKEYDVVKIKLATITDVMQKFYDEYGIALKEDRYMQLTDLKKYIKEFEKVSESLDEMLSAKKKFELENDDLVEALNLPDDIENDNSLAMIANQQRELTNNLHMIQKSILDYDKQIGLYEEKYEIICQNENELIQMQEKQSDGMRKYEHLLKTKEYLGKAKESFTSRYMSPIMNGFEKYINIWAANEGKRYKIDSHTEITVEEKGMQRSVKYLSEGYKDMIGICMRMALVDAMYADEKPFIVLDDPFVNLDDEKSKMCMKFLKELGKEYQVIYFTCNSHRCEI